MARFLMVESWLGSAGEALPRLLAAREHRFTLLTREPERYAAAAHPAHTLAEEVIAADTHEPDAARAAARHAHRTRPLDGVVTTCDYYVALAAAIADDLGLPGAPPEVAAAAVRKDRVRRALADAGLPNPAFAVAATLADARAAAHRIGYPLVAKPVDLHSGTLVRRIEDDTQLAAWFAEADALDRNCRGQRRHGGVLLEEVLTGPELSVETATHRGGTTVVGITDKSITGAPGFVESGHQFPAPLDGATATSVGTLVRDALAAIGWTHGVGHTEVMLTPDGPRIVEINPRQGGNHIFDLVRLVTGRSTLDDVVDLALDRGRAGAGAGGVTTPAPGGPDGPGLSGSSGSSDGGGPDGGGPAASAAVHFVMAPRDGKVVAVRGGDGLDGDPAVARVVLPTELPVAVRRPRDNEDYLGHVLAVDREGAGARPLAERAVARLRLAYDDGTDAVPLGVEPTP